MSDRYFRKKVKDINNNDTINDLTNIVLDLQRKVEDNINLKKYSYI